MQKIAFYITVPPYSAGDTPGLEHAYQALAADILARHKRAKQVPVYFQTGGAEHGSRVGRTAAEKNVTAETLCDSASREFTGFWKLLNVSYDRCLRTGDPRHGETVRAAFEKLLKAGDIYSGRRESAYCRACARFYAARELRNGNCPVHGTPAEITGEDACFFRLSRYGGALRAHYAANPGFIAPPGLAREAANFVSGGLKDVPVSQGGTQPGIKTLSDPERTISAWFDTLLGYATGPGYGPDGPSDGFQMKWPADIHLAGKESLHFHAVLWPALLMALGLEPPKAIRFHGRWSVPEADEGAARPQEAVMEYGADALRYFMFSEVPFGADGRFAAEALKRRYDSDLADGLGNLFSRVLGMVRKYLAGSLPGRPGNAALFSELSARGPEIDRKIDAMEFRAALEEIMSAAASLDAAIEKNKPWELADAEPEKLRSFLHDLVWSLRAIAGWIYPFMPDTATKMQLDLAASDIPVSGFEAHRARALFPKKRHAGPP